MKELIAAKARVKQATSTGGANPQLLTTLSKGVPIPPQYARARGKVIELYQMRKFKPQYARARGNSSDKLTVPVGAPPVRTREGYKTANIADLQTPALRLEVGNRVGNGFKLMR